MLAGARWLKRTLTEGIAPKGCRAISAGTRPASHINPVAVQVMNEVGINISGQKSQIITEDMIKSSAKSVNMGCIDKAE